MARPAARSGGAGPRRDHHLGCGTGSFAVSLARRAPSARVVGLDPDGDILARAARKAEAAGQSVRFVQGFARDVAALVGAGAGGADTVVSSLVFHQLPMEEKRLGLAATWRALKPGGALDIADYGRQRGAARTLFRIVQSLDGYENTQPNGDGAPGSDRGGGFHRRSGNSCSADPDRIDFSLSSGACGSHHNIGGGAAMRRLMLPGRVVWDGMGFSSVRQGLMTALLAAFLSLFVLVSAVDAATCNPETVTAPASTALADSPLEQDGGSPKNHLIGCHCHCHHGVVAPFETPDTSVAPCPRADLNILPLTDGLPSRMPDGPERPPRG